MPFDRELWKHSTPKSFEQQAQEVAPNAPIAHQEVLTVSVNCATKALSSPKKPARKPKRKQSR